MTDDLRWSATSLIERTVLGGDLFRDLDGRHWIFDVAGGWLRHTASGWQPDPDVPRMLEGSTGPLGETARRTSVAPPTTVSELIDRRVTDLARAYRAGELSSGPAEAALLGLLAADGEGRLWTVGPRTGSWFVVDGGTWRAAACPDEGAFTDAPDPARVAGNAPTADMPLLPERITAPWDPPAAPPPSVAPEPERARTSGGGARRALGVVLTAVGLVSTAFGLVNGLTGDDTGVTASPTTTIAPVVATTAPATTTTVEEPTTTTTVRVERREEPLVAAQVKASSSLPSTATTSYDPSFAIDGRRETAWCVADDGTGESLAIELGGNPTVTRVGIVPGYDKTEGGDRWTENRRPTFVTWSFSSEAQYDQNLDPDDRSMQLFQLPSPEQGSRLYLTIGGTTGAADGDTCISEIALVGYPG